ncbi:MAG: 1-acyl-sn-glycerol-3-phosphate acyltransferase [Sedimentisphaerales bacterium]|nr:1-acyl-sn-glycerol-3-phosphate acyltransferase [Sedimentisphaerales bacterium]
MVDILLKTVVRWLISLRYRVRLVGMDKIAAKGKNGIVFFPNHPALIDPVILYAYLHPEFGIHGIGDRDQVERPVIRWFAKRLGVRPIGSMATDGSAARSGIERVLDESIAGLKNGENLILWPAGQIYRSGLENLRGNSSVERILRQHPDARVVLVRTRGLWGSRFGWASGNAPQVGKILSRGVWQLLAGGIFFAPRREVTIEFYEPDIMSEWQPPKVDGANYRPPAGRSLPPDRNTLNRFLEAYYNENAPQAKYVPSTLWERGGTRTMPEPALPKLAGDETAVPAATRQMVLEYLTKLSGVANPKDSDHLARDLGLDSLARTDVLLA